MSRWDKAFSCSRLLDDEKLCIFVHEATAHSNKTQLILIILLVFSSFAFFPPRFFHSTFCDVFPRKTVISLFIFGSKRSYAWVKVRKISADVFWGMSLMMADRRLRRMENFLSPLFVYLLRVVNIESWKGRKFYACFEPLRIFFDEEFSFDLLRNEISILKRTK